MKHTTLPALPALPHPPRWRSALLPAVPPAAAPTPPLLLTILPPLAARMPGDYESYSAESAAAGEGSSFSSDDLTSSMLDPSTVESSRKIVYNASVRMETTDYDTTRAGLQEAVTAANGYLESTDQGGSKDSGSRYTYYTARIPAENYRSFLTAAGKPGT